MLEPRAEVLEASCEDMKSVNEVLAEHRKNSSLHSNIHANLPISLEAFLYHPVAMEKRLGKKNGTKSNKSEICRL